jgi:adenylylsulfate kinase
MATGTVDGGWVLWFTGLPGSGKSTIAHSVHTALLGQGRDVALLVMDERRRSYFPKPAYTEEERKVAYELIAHEAAELAAQGQGVILDATGHRLAVRQEARALVPRFAEVYVNCPLPEAMRREAVRSSQLPMGGHPHGYAVTPGMYQRALLRRRTGEPMPGLGQVVGVDVPFEEDAGAECILDALQPVPENVARVLTFLDGWLPGYAGGAA